MSMPDINIIKFLSVNIKKAFDKGEIDKVYKSIYATANGIAAEETKTYMISMRQKYLENKVGFTKSEEDKHLLLSKIPDYKNERIQFHIEQMFRLLDLYVSSKYPAEPT